MSTFDRSINSNGDDLVHPLPGSFQEWNRDIMTFPNIVDHNSNVKILHQCGQALVVRRVILRKPMAKALMWIPEYLDSIS